MKMIIVKTTVCVLCSFFVISCASTGGTRIEKMALRNNASAENAITAAGYVSGGKMMLFTSGGAKAVTLPENIAGKIGPISFLQIIAPDRIAVVSLKKGIFIFTVNPASDAVSAADAVHLPLGEKMLPEQNIRFLMFDAAANKLYIAYDNTDQTAVTVCTIAPGAETAYAQMTMLNTPLKNRFVHQIVSDVRGNIWFRYSANEGAGISRLNADGSWHHFDKNNSELGSSSVSLIACEKSGEGLPGDNVWFVSKAGLSRLQYTDSGEQWKLYGQKQTTTNLIVSAIGIESWFTDAILNITDVEIIPDSILISNRDAVFHFNGETVNRFIPEAAGGIDRNAVYDIEYRNGYAIAKITSLEKSDGLVCAVMIFDMKNRQWKRLSYWDFAKEYPREIVLIPGDGGIDTVVLLYSGKREIICTYEYANGDLKRKDSRQ